MVASDVVFMEDFMFIFDRRWFGEHGIGRFAKEVYVRCESYFKSSVILHGKPYRFYDGLYLSLKLAFNNGIFFSPGFNSPLFYYGQYILTIHDLNHIDFSQARTFMKSIYYRFILMRAVRNAFCVFTVSEYSKSRIIEWSGIEPHKVVNVGNGVDGSFSSFVSPLVTSYRYLLCVSNRKLHKNEFRLIRAFAISSIDSHVKLVFTGSPSSELLSLIDELSFKDRIVFIGRVADKDLPSLYRGALGLLFPSLYEGFGLPVVEAMACGIPVLTSNTTSLPEVAGDAALLVNPESIDEIRAGIERLVNEEGLRSELIAKGLERAKLFSWDAVAARVQAVLDEVTNQHGK